MQTSVKVGVCVCCLSQDIAPVRALSYSDRAMSVERGILNILDGPIMMDLNILDGPIMMDEYNYAQWACL
jgi:hypothetical protein